MNLMFSNNDIIVRIPLPFLLIFLLLHFLHERLPLFVSHSLHLGPPISLQTPSTLPHNFPLLHLRNIKIIMRSPHNLTHRRKILCRMFRIILKLARACVESGGEPVFTGLGVVNVVGGTFFAESSGVEDGWVGGESGFGFWGGKTWVKPG